jgi:hypothetical protein
MPNPEAKSNAPALGWPSLQRKRPFPPQRNRPKPKPAPGANERTAEARPTPSAGDGAEAGASRPPRTLREAGARGDDSAQRFQTQPGDRLEVSPIAGCQR